MRKKYNSLCLISYGALIVLGATACQPRFPTTGWPVDATNTEHEIGNSGGEFQQYGGNPYFHAGIDILDDPAPNGPWVRVARVGTPGLSLPGAASTQNGLTITAGGDTYLYWHLDFNSVQQAVRNAVNNGTNIAVNAQVSRLHIWPSCNFDHLHYELSDGAGTMDPIFTLNPRNDTDSPLVLSVYFTENATNNQVPLGALGIPILSDDVDVIAHAHDRQFGTDRTGVMEIRYEVKDTGGTEVKAPIILRFRNIPADANAGIIYRNAAPYDSDSNYCGTENYYYVPTNVDAAGSIISDATGLWDTTAVANGTYFVEITVEDPSGNDFTLIKQVTIDN